MFYNDSGKPADAPHRCAAKNRKHIMDKPNVTATPESKIEPKKRSAFKRGVIRIAILSVLGGTGYVAYQQGAMDQYLPHMLQAKGQPEAISAVANADLAVAKNAENANATPHNASAQTMTDLQVAMQQQAIANAASAANKSNPPVGDGGVSNNNLSVAAPNSGLPNIVINGASANALLTAYDAQWQWSSVTDDFIRRADASLALQNAQNLKSQLQASKDPAFAPALSALAQTETQLQAWSSVPSAAFLKSLAQSLEAIDKLDVKNKDVALISVANMSWWERIIASLKNVVEIKKIDNAKEAQMLNPATAALVKQSIIARLLSAQWAAQTGQWSSAQQHAKAATEMATQWSDVNALASIKPLVDAAAFPAQPDFSAVSTALQQARNQLTSSARAQQSVPVVEHPAPKPDSKPAEKPLDKIAADAKGGA